jgi:hypothetical protein
MQRKEALEAGRFHQLAWPWLSETGFSFSLISDPDKVVGPHRKSHALYRSQRGFHFLAGFMRGDGNGAALSCGRLWSEKGPFGWFTLSSEYFELAKQFGFDLPKYYNLGYGKEVSKALEAIVDDLKETLPAIVSGVTLTDLVGVERSEFGAQRIAEAVFGEDVLQHTKVSEFYDS